MRLTIIIEASERMNAGTISYSVKIPPSAERFFQTRTVMPPTSIPAKAPFHVVRLQKSAVRTIGPNVAPSPAHAKDTTLKTELLGLS